MKVNSYISKEFSYDAERITFEEIIAQLERCESDIEIWIIGNIELPNTQIDVLIVKENCLITIDMKNYTGKIIGSENGDWNVETEKGILLSIHKNCFQQARTQRFSLKDKLVNMVTLGHLVKFKGDPRILIFSKAWIYFNEGSIFDYNQIGQNAFNWFKVITRETLCKEIANAESTKYRFNHNEIDELIAIFRAEPIDIEKKYKSLIDETWSKIEAKPKDLEVAKEANKIFKEILTSTKNKELRIICQHGIALTSETYQEYFEGLLDLHDSHKEYSGFKGHKILYDIFTVYINWNGNFSGFEEGNSFDDKVHGIFLELKLKNQIKTIRDIFFACIGPAKYMDPMEKIYGEMGEFLANLYPNDIEVLDGIYMWYFYKDFDKFISTAKKLLFNNIEEIIDFILDAELHFFPEKDFSEIIEKLKTENNSLPIWKLNIFLGNFYRMKLSNLGEEPEIEIERLWNEADRIYVETAEKNMNNKECLFAIISWYARQNEFEKTDKYAKALFEIPDIEIKEMSLLIDIYKKTGEITKDRSYLFKAIEKGLEKYSSDLNINVKAGQIYKEFGMKDKAIECFKRALESPKFRYELKVVSSIDLNHRYPPPLEYETGRISIRAEGKIAFESLLDLYFEREDYHESYDLCRWLETQNISDSKKYNASAYFKIGDWLVSQYKSPHTDKKAIEKLQSEKVEVKESLKDFGMSPELHDKIEFIIHRVKDEKHPESILLIGPPGCGKTELARCIAGEIGVEYRELTSEVLSKWVGKSEKNIRDIFDGLKNNKKGVLFMDEFESFGVDRHKLNHSWEYSISSEMLRQIEKIMRLKDAQILMIAATNLPDELDTAMVRPGRFNRKIEIGPPDMEVRKKIFRIKIDKLKLDGYIAEDKLNYDEFADKTEGFTGADIHNIVFEIIQQIIYKRKEKKLINNEIILEAIKSYKGQDESVKVSEVPYHQ